MPGLSGQVYDDDLPYTTLSYANGQGYHYHNLAFADQVVRRDLTPEAEDAKSFEYFPTSSAELDSETHGGDDVAIFANGPMAHLFHRTHEQAYIAHVMAFSACIGPYASDPRRCRDTGEVHFNPHIYNMNAVDPISGSGTTSGTETTTMTDQTVIVVAIVAFILNSPARVWAGGF